MLKQLEAVGISMNGHECSVHIEAAKLETKLPERETLKTTTSISSIWRLSLSV